MPQVIISPSVLREERPKVIALIGQIAVSWSHHEWLLADLFSHLIFGETVFGDAPFAPRGDEAAAQTVASWFKNIRMQSQREELMAKLILARGGGEKHALWSEQVDRLLKAARVLRNDAIHTVWGVSAAYPELVIAKNSNLRWAVRDFEAVISSIGEASAAAQKFLTTDWFRASAKPSV